MEENVSTPLRDLISPSNVQKLGVEVFEYCGDTHEESYDEESYDEERFRRPSCKYK